jgi:DUF4097 and DUF4098 domain-containing protein YvlB
MTTMNVNRNLVDRFSWLALLAMATAGTNLSYAQATREWGRQYSTRIAEPVIVHVEVEQADLQLAYAREGEVSIFASARVTSGTEIEENYFARRSVIDQSGNQISIRELPGASGSDRNVRMTYRIDVPYRTEVQTHVVQGNQLIMGVEGPVTARSDIGDIKVSYVSHAVTAGAGTGNIDLQVVGARIDARTGTGNISCSRAMQGVSAQTTDGDITLMVVGSSTATIRSGSGRIDAGGIRGTLLASTAAGDLHVKAVPHDDWQLNSLSGNIRVELPPQAGFEVQAITESGDLIVSRDDLEKPSTGARRLDQKANGGGKHIDIRSGTGKIAIS